MGGSVAKADTPAQVGQLGRLATKLLRESSPVRQELLGQQLEALRTGGVGARIPIIQNAVAASKQATGDAVQNTQSQLATQSLGGTVFGNRLLQEAKMSGDQATARIPTDYASTIIKGIPSFISQITNLASGNLQNAASLDLNTQQFNDLQSKAFYEDLKQSIMSASGAGIAAGGGGGGGGGFSSLSGVNQGVASGALQVDQ